jgi:hypothetical protein
MNRYDWHRWFAWYPVEVNGKRTFLRWVKRRLRGALAPNGDLADGYWEYGPD